MVSRSLFSASLAILFLTGCTAALNTEDACSELNGYASEVSFSIQEIGDNLQDNERRNRFAERMSELGVEIATLNIGDAELADTAEAWAEEIEKYGDAYQASSIEELIDDANYDKIMRVSDELSLLTKTIERRCG